LINKVKEYIETNSMFSKGDSIVVALSGGPDSICMLHILKELEEEYCLKLYAAHVNHCLRGAESDEDEEYSRSFCKALNIPFYSTRVDIQKYSKEKGISCEMAGRELRYIFFNKIKNELKAQRIALAHNANDQAETVLMRLIRGSGIEGLRGIRAVRDELYIRPILILTRDEVEAYCEEKQLNARIDRTNLENIYNRNKIRLELIPYIQNNFNSDIIQTLNRFALLVDKDNDFLEGYAEEKFRLYCRFKKDKIIINAEAFRIKEAVSTRIIRKALQKMLNNLYNIESNHIYDIIHLAGLGTGKRLMLPSKVLAENVYGDIHIYFRRDEELKNTFESVEIKIKGEQGKDLKEGYSVIIPDYNIELGLKLINKVESISLGENNGVKYFDFDKIKGDIIIRNRKAGDRFHPYGMKGSKKVKDLFIDLKIPQNLREKIPFLCFGEEIAWIIGYRMSEKFKVEKKTNNILEVTIKER
jgi:tRNA(Ile)-lysidine synthase